MSIQKIPEAESPPPRWTSHAIEWGLPSILLGLVTLGMFLVWGIAGAFAMWVSDRVDHSAANVREVGSVLALSSVPLLGLAGIGLLFGVLGLYHALACKLPAGVPATAILICLVVLVLLVIGRVTFAESERTTVRNLEQWRLR